MGDLLLAEAVKLEKELLTLDAHYFYARRLRLAALMIGQLRMEIESLRETKTTDAGTKPAGTHGGG